MMLYLSNAPLSVILHLSVSVFYEYGPMPPVWKVEVSLAPPRPPQQHPPPDSDAYVYAWYA